MPKSPDLFDDTTMTFGEHLEVLRIHLWKAIVGLFLAVIIALVFGQQVVGVVRRPIDEALQRHSKDESIVDDVDGVNLWESAKAWWEGSEESPEPVEEDAEPDFSDTISVTVNSQEIADALVKVNPQAGIDTSKIESQEISISIRAPEFVAFKKAYDKSTKPVTLKVEEAFMTYLKVSFVAGLVLASPWIFFQVWQFVAAGLYSHERKYVYTYLPMSLFFFLAGGAFCFYLVFPFVLDFLLGWNSHLGVSPQIRLSEWISFALMLPVMFGISFQLPLVMMFLERIDVFDQAAYRERRRMAILVIAFLSMMLTPADPTSMLLMMFPLILLYELGIIMCGFSLTDSAPTEPTT
ncbi:MAG: twin-arginine translocase subunit TatC [Planctomycetaceae bacterium]